MKMQKLFAAAVACLFPLSAVFGQSGPSTNGLILWLDATAPGSVITNSNGAVSSWLNLAPGATNGVSYTGSNDNDTSASYNTDAPVYAAAPNFNGRPVVNFDGYGYLDDLGFSGETPLNLTIFMLASATTNRGDYSAFMAFDLNESANDYQTGLNFDQGQNASAVFNRLNVEGAKGGGNGGFQLLQTATLQFNTFNLFEIDYGGGPTSNNDVFSVLVNDAEAGSETGSANPVALNNCYIGARCFAEGYTTGENNDMVGQIAAVLVYDTNLTGAALAQTRAYLYNLLPMQLTIVPTHAGAAIFSWNSLPGAQYQLQTTISLTAPNWQNIGGAVTATNTLSLTTEPLTNGASFFRLQLLQ